MENYNQIQQISLLKDKYIQEGVEIRGIFGSFARGENNKYSDIDIAFQVNRDVFDSKYKGGFEKLLRLNEIKNEIEKNLGLQVDFIQIQDSDSPINQEIKRDIVYV